MQEVIDVNTGEVFVSNGLFTLRSLAIGSCVVISAFDPKNQNAGLAHIMLADCAPEKSLKKTKYASNGIEHLLHLMLEAGSSLNDIDICLVGAGNVLRKEDDTICQNNIDSVTNVLNNKAIPIRASAVGGYLRKSIFLDAETGYVSYTQGDSPVELLWQPLETKNTTK